MGGLVVRHHQGKHGRGDLAGSVIADPGDDAIADAAGDLELIVRVLALLMTANIRFVRLDRPEHRGLMSRQLQRVLPLGKPASHPRPSSPRLFTVSVILNPERPMRQRRQVPGRHQSAPGPQPR